jgi:transcription antitermination factor NusG
MQPYSGQFQVSSDATTAPWYVAYTKHQHEKTARDFLSRKGFEVLLPIYSAAHRWKDRTKTVLLPVFPCYLFVRSSLDKKLDILRAPGVFWLVESGGRACEVPESDIAGIRKIVQSSARAEPHPLLKSGEYVRVSRGPLMGLQGILTRMKNNFRVVLSVDLLQKGIAVEVDISTVEPLDRNHRGLISS